MMKRYGILVMVMVLAVTSLLAAAAYNSATVVNAATLAVVNTQKGILYLSPGGTPGNGDVNAYINGNGELVFDFTKGLPQYGSLGVQPGGIYKWERLFWVRNQSTEGVKLAISTSLPYTTIGLELNDLVSGNKTQWWHWDYSETWFTDGKTASLGPDTSVPILVTIAVPSGAALATFTGTITVSATNP